MLSSICTGTLFGDVRCLRLRPAGRSILIVSGYHYMVRSTLQATRKLFLVAALPAGLSLAACNTVEINGRLRRCGLFRRRVACTGGGGDRSSASGVVREVCASGCRGRANAALAQLPTLAAAQGAAGTSVTKERPATGGAPSTLPDAVARAIAMNPQIGLAMARFQESKAAVAAARAPGRPQLDASVGAGLALSAITGPVLATTGIRSGRRVLPALRPTPISASSSTTSARRNPTSTGRCSRWTRMASSRWPQSSRSPTTRPSPIPAS